MSTPGAQPVPVPPQGQPRWRRDSLMDQISERRRGQMQAQGRLVAFGGGEVLASQGSRQPAVFVVTSGVVKVTRSALPDSAPMLATLLFPGDVPGAADALLGKRGHVTYTATKQTTAVAIPREVFTSFVRRHHDVTTAMCSVMAHELRVRDMSLAYAPMDVKARLIAFLGRQQVVSGIPTRQGVMLDLGLSHADFAAAIGAAPTTVSKAIAELRDEGKISIGYRTVYIKQQLSPDAPALST